MLEALRRRLTVSAAGRDLAVGLARAHGAAGRGILEAISAQNADDDLTRDILARARIELGRPSMFRERHR